MTTAMPPAASPDPASDDTKAVLASAAPPGRPPIEITVSTASTGDDGNEELVPISFPAWYLEVHSNGCRKDAADCLLLDANGNTTATIGDLLSLSLRQVKRGLEDGRQSLGLAAAEARGFVNWLTFMVHTGDWYSTRDRVITLLSNGWRDLTVSIEQARWLG